MVHYLTQTILKFDQLADRDASRTDRENCFAEICSQVFASDFNLPSRLRKFGFGCQTEATRIWPYNIYEHSEAIPIDAFGNLDIPELSEGASNYPIIAGSSIVFGPDHRLVEDIDLVTYLPISSDDDDRREIGQRLRNYIQHLNPTETKFSYGEQKGQQRCSLDRLSTFLDHTIPLSSDAVTAIAIGNINFIHLEFEENQLGTDKPASLRIYLAHENEINTDIFPYQELHECDPNDYFHANKHWLKASYSNYVAFLKAQTSSEGSNKNPVKKAKRTMMLLGMLGRFAEQAEIKNLLIETAEKTRTEVHALNNKMNEISEKLVLELQYEETS